MDSDTGGDAVRGTGARLRMAREGKGLTVLQAAERLYVDTRIIEALETEDFAALGADVFVRGHLKRYAELVGESPAQLQGLYASSTQSARPDLTHIPHVNVAREAAPWRTPVLLGLGAFSLVAAVWWLLGLPVEKPRALVAPPAERAGGLTAGGVAGGTAAGAAAAGAAPQLALRFYALSWVEVSDASGRRLLQGLFAAGSERTVSGQAPLRIVLGNTPVVELKVNGQAVPLESLVGRDGTAHLLIDAQGRASQAPSRLASGG